MTSPRRLLIHVLAVAFLMPFSALASVCCPSQDFSFEQRIQSTCCCPASCEVTQVACAQARGFDHTAVVPQSWHREDSTSTAHALLTSRQVIDDLDDTNATSFLAWFGGPPVTSFPHAISLPLRL